MSAGPSVLIVEDEGVVALNISQRLRELEYVVAGVCATGEESIEQAQALHPDIVLMDVHLAGKMDGIEAAERIQQRMKLPVVFLTAYAERETLERARGSLPHGFLVKPFEARELHATLQMALARRAVEAAVEAGEERLRVAVEAADLGVWELDVQRRRFKPGGRLPELLGEDIDALGESCPAFLRRVDSRDRATVAAALETALAANQPFHSVFRGVRSDGAARWFEAHGMLSSSGAGTSDLRMVGVLRDITLGRTNELRLQEAAAVLDAAAEAIVVLDHNGVVLAVNPAFITITGCAAEHAVGRHWSAFLAESEAEVTGKAIRAALADTGRWRGEIELLRASGESFPAWLSISAVQTPEAAWHEVWVVTDISLLRRTEEQLRHAAYHDALTDLPNRLLFDERLTQALAHAQRHRETCAVLLLDLDGFKMVNDTLGHPAGDRLLQTVATRVTGCLRREDLVARLGGDEFAVLLSGPTAAKDAPQVSAKIVAAVAEPVHLGDRRMAVTASVGVSICPDDGTSSEDLLKAADLAMYSAKAAGRSTYRLYNRELAARLAERMLIENALREALQGQGLVLHFQPQIALNHGSVVGVEALLRLDHPQLGRLLPTRLVEIAESCGLIAPVGRWVLHAACHAARRWAGRGLRCAINCSALELAADDYAAGVAQALADSGLPASMLEIEITESTLHDLSDSADRLRELQALGVSIAVDDFGVGYSSLAALKHLPIDRLKIDRSFTHDIPGNTDAASIVSAIIGLGHTLGLPVLGEGVETQAQLSFLRQHGCDEVQGNCIARPLSAQDLAVFLGAAR